MTRNQRNVSAGTPPIPVVAVAHGAPVASARADASPQLLLSGIAAVIVVWFRRLAIRG